MWPCMNWPVAISQISSSIGLHLPHYLLVTGSLRHSKLISSLRPLHFLLFLPPNAFLSDVCMTFSDFIQVSGKHHPFQQILLSIPCCIIVFLHCSISIYSVLLFFMALLLPDVILCTHFFSSDFCRRM